MNSEEVRCAAARHDLYFIGDSSLIDLRLSWFHILKRKASAHADVFLFGLARPRGETGPRAVCGGRARFFPPPQNFLKKGKNRFTSGILSDTLYFLLLDCMVSGPAGGGTGRRGGGRAR